MKTITKYILNCKECKKEISFDREPQSYEQKDFTCEKCLSLKPEPLLEDYDNFNSFISSLSNWKYNTKKEPTYDYNNIMEDAFKSYGVKGNKAKKAWAIAYEQGHSSGYSEVVNYFDGLVELIN